MEDAVTGSGEFKTVKKVVRGGVGSCNRLRAIKWCTERSLGGFSRPEEVVRPKKEGEGRGRDGRDG